MTPLVKQSLNQIFEPARKKLNQVSLQCYHDRYVDIAFSELGVEMHGWALVVFQRQDLINFLTQLVPLDIRVIAVNVILKHRPHHKAVRFGKRRDDPNAPQLVDFATAYLQYLSTVNGVG